MKKPFVFLCLVAAILVIARTADSATIFFQESMSPTFLFNNAIFPSRTSTLDSGGAFLDFGDGISEWEKLIEFPLVDAGTLPVGVPAMVSIEIDAEALNPGDNDLGIMVSDGINVVGFMRGDNADGSGWLEEGLNGYSTLLDVVDTEILRGVGFPNVFSADILLDVFTQVTGKIGSNEASATATRIVDPTSDISLVVFSDHPYENYRIYSIDVTVSAVPIPSAIWFLWSGLVGIVGLRNKLYKVK